LVLDKKFLRSQEALNTEGTGPGCWGRGGGGLVRKKWRPSPGRKRGGKAKQPPNDEKDLIRIGGVTGEKRDERNVGRGGPKKPD